MSVNEKMTAIADEIRELSGTSEAMGLDAMATNLDDANTAVVSQSDLIMQIAETLNGKARPTQYNLAGKKILILGDSVNAGALWTGGFANLIAEDFPNAIVNNKSISGSNIAGGDLYWQLVTAYQEGFMADYIVFDGGGNDILNGKTIGTLDPDIYSAGGQGEEFDMATTIGAFEHLVTNVQKFFPNSKLIFFNLYKLHPTATNVTYAQQRQMWEPLREACKKYAVYHVDLYGAGNFTPNSQAQFDAFMGDWIHINEAGYRRFWPPIKNALLNA